MDTGTAVRRICTGVSGRAQACTWALDSFRRREARFPVIGINDIMMGWMIGGVTKGVTDSRWLGEWTIDNTQRAVNESLESAAESGLCGGIREGGRMSTFLRGLGSLSHIACALLAPLRTTLAHGRILSLHISIGYENT